MNILSIFCGILNWRKASPRTPSGHTKMTLKTFLPHVKTKPENIDMLDVRAFVADQIRKGLNKTTVSRRLSSVRSFFKFLYREGHLQKNPAKLVSGPKLPKLLPKFLSVDDAFSLVEKPEGMGLAPARHRAILELLYSSRLRLAATLQD